jgi:competence protein ComEA
MAELSRFQLFLCAVGAVVVLFLGLRHLDRGGGEPPAAAAPSPAPIRVESSGDQRVLVHVAGAVRRPGVYRLTASARVDDAVRLAGGPTRRADLGGLNLAAKLEDGRQVLVPERVKAVAPAGAGSTAGPAAGAAGSAPAQPLNLNTATLEQLDVLPGIGPAMAQRIIDHREANGGFGSVEELTDVPGIGEVRMASLRDQVRV